MRVKIDMDIENDKRAHPRTSTEESVLKRVRENIVSNLKSFDSPKVFLVSNYHRRRWDFSDLCVQMIESFSETKKAAFILSLDSISKTIIAAKRGVLFDRVWLDSTFSGICSLIIPGTGIAIDESLIKAEVEFFKQQLGLRDECLKDLSLEINEDEHYLRHCLESQNALSQLSEENLLQEIVSNPNYGGFLKTVGERCANFPFVNGITSFAATVKVLHDVIIEMEKEAFAVLELVARRMSDNRLQQLLN